MRILIVEGDKKIASFLIKGHKQEGFAVDHVTNGEDGLHLALREPCDAAVLDVMLPELDGLRLIEEIRRGKVKTPVIILSAKYTADHRVKGLQAGSDNSLIKPFASESFMPECWRSSVGRVDTQSQHGLRLETVEWIF